MIYSKSIPLRNIEQQISKWCCGFCNKYVLRYGFTGLLSSRIWIQSCPFPKLLAKQVADDITLLYSPPNAWTSDFYFRVILLLNCLPAKAEEPSFDYYLTYSWGLGRRDSYFSRGNLRESEYGEHDKNSFRVGKKLNAANSTRIHSEPLWKRMRWTRQEFIPSSYVIAANSTRICCVH